MKGSYSIYIIGMFVLFLVQNSQAQKFALKTNVIGAGIGTLNLGGEVPLSGKWSLELMGKYNPWTFSDNKKWKYWQLQPALRYWRCEKKNGHFFSFHAMGGEFNMSNVNLNVKFLATDFGKMKNNRYEGWYFGGGLGYGYVWILGRHWNLEGEIGVGYVYSDYDQYYYKRCSEKSGHANHHYFGPTKAGVNIVYKF